jgi:hypothetical protein
MKEMLILNLPFATFPMNFLVYLVNLFKCTASGR